MVEDAGFSCCSNDCAGVAAVLVIRMGAHSAWRDAGICGANCARGQCAVTADMEAGYCTTPSEMAETARSVAAGIVGLNLEDVTGDDESSAGRIAFQMEKIAAVREASALEAVGGVGSCARMFTCSDWSGGTRFERT